MTKLEQRTYIRMNKDFVKFVAYCDHLKMKGKFIDFDKEIDRIDKIIIDIKSNNNKLIDDYVLEELMTKKVYLGMMVMGYDKTINENELIKEYKDWIITSFV